MRIRAYYWAVPLAGLLAACSVTAPIARRGYHATVVHTPKQMRQRPQNTDSRNYTEIKHDDRPTEYIVPTQVVDGERMISLTLDAVTVVAKSRSLPERLGKVDVDFVVTLPKQLQGDCRYVSVTPVLHNHGEKEPLQDLTIRGRLFSRIQERDYWQYDRYKEVYNPDSLGAA